MRKILHFDLDCFYAAVEEKDDPSLRGKPVAVGSPMARGVVTTANYAARAFGVRSAIPSSRAVRLCPHITFVRPHFDRYKEESREIRKIFERYTSKIEPLSLDEAYLDVTDIATLPGDATKIAREIKAAVKAERDLTISAGVAPNKFLAKIASDWKKPDGLFVIAPEKVAAFVLQLPVEKIYGVGKVTAAKFHGLGIRTCKDLQDWSIDDLTRQFGSRASDFYRLARGEDDRQVEDDGERKSLSVEETYSSDLNSWGDIKAELPALYLDWKTRIEKNGLQSRVQGAVVKMKFTDFKSCTHEQASKEFPTLETFERLTFEAWSKRPEPVRLLGLGSRLGSAVIAENPQLSLLGEA